MISRKENFKMITRMIRKFKNRFLPLYAFFQTILFFSCTGYSIRTPSSPRFTNENQRRLWHHAQSFLGIPYKPGGSDQSGMDCSGLVVRIYRDIYAIQLPHNSSELYKMSRLVSVRSLAIGDLVFFREAKGTQPSHVGIYLGNGTFIHASESKGVIRSNLKEKYYQKRFVSARRID